MRSKSFVYEISIDIESTSVFCSEGTLNSLKNAVDHFNSVICDMLAELGIVNESNLPVNISQMNGGYAIYNKFKLHYDIVNAVFLIDVRCGDHDSKPNLPTKTARRLSRDTQIYVDVDPENIKVDDTYCNMISDGSFVYYVGEDTHYSKPIEDESVAANIVINRIKTFLSDKLATYCDVLLSQYVPEAVALASEYVEQSTDVDISVDTGDTQYSKSDPNYLKDLHETYLLTGFEMDVFDDASEFDQICEIIRIKNMF